VVSVPWSIIINLLKLSTPNMTPRTQINHSDPEPL
jgi:hypothetical protein